ncbi:AAA family ATPase [Anaerospora hongkongensis]|uniref:AAA family ATPase n=1 Tax=Anaerospora hongkongensis TaxID=244830 RepID=UPI00289CA5D2|nr:AAA family ATPase [Anaerospora hongkongensis]
MKLNRLLISGYKNLIDFDFLLENFNVLVGVNNSGKSNILEVFKFLDEFLNGSDETRFHLFSGRMPESTYFRTYGRKRKNIDLLKIDIEFSEIIKEIEYKYWYSIQIQLAETKLKDTKPGFIKHESFKYKAKKSTGPSITIFERDVEKVNRIGGNNKGLTLEKGQPAISIINKLKEIKESLDIPAQIGLAAIFIICKTPVLYSAPEIIRGNIKSIFRKGKISCASHRLLALELDNEIDTILKSKSKEMFLQVVSSLLDIKDIEPIRMGTEDEASSPILFTNIVFNNGARSFLEMVSDGTLATLNLITYLISTKYPIIAIEEPENSIHPKLLRMLIDIIKNNFSDRQILITTHSPILLNMVNISDISIVKLDNCGIASVERVLNKKDLVKRLSGPFASHEDIFYDLEENIDICPDEN